MTRRKASSASDRVLFDWSAEALTKARALWDAGYSASEIGRAIGTSKNSLVGKAHRLGWSSRPSPIKNPGQRKPRRPPTIGYGRTLPAMSATPLAVEPIVLSSTGRCSWIEGAPSKHAVFCDAPTQRGSSYCPEHHARCWVTPIAVNKISEIGPVPMRDGRAADRTASVSSQ